MHSIHVSTQKGGPYAPCCHVSGCQSVPNHFLNFRNKLLSPEMRTSDWLLMCLFVIGCDQRDHHYLWCEDCLIWNGSTATTEHPSWLISHSASSYQTAGNKIIIKDICCGDLSVIIAQASKNASGLLRLAQQCHKGQYGWCKFCSDRTKWLSSHR